MLIGKDWKIEGDELNVVLSKRTIHHERKSGKPYESWDFIGYYGTVLSALKGLVDQGIRDTELKDVRAVNARIDELYRLIEGLKIKVTIPSTYK